jgi:hypothetical protein
MTLFILILITLAGYCTGATLAPLSRRRRADPGLLDCGLIGLGLLFEIAYFRGTPHSAMILAVLLSGSAVIAFALHSFLNSRIGFGTSGDEFTSIRDFVIPAEVPIWRRAWLIWKNFAAESADFQGRLLVSLVYFTLLWPFSLFVPSPPRPNERLSNWQPRKLSRDHARDSLRQY